jgi:hypothetical protein
MDREALQKGISQLRGGLDLVLAQSSSGDRLQEGMRDLGIAVDNVRTTLWTILKEKHPRGYEALLGRMRVRRAIDTCEEILADVRAETMNANTPGFKVFQATLHELSDVCRKA